jgi:ketosteroid isomerase-like protein
MNPNIAVITRFFAAINRNDMLAIAEDFDPEIVRVEPEGFPTAGTYRGVAAVQGHVRKGRGTWAEGSCDPEGFFEGGDKVVVYLHAWVRLHGRTDWTGGRFADGFVLREGRIVEYRSFADRADALKWAGIEDPAGSGPA